MDTTDFKALAVAQSTESALITRIIVLRVKGKTITPEAILSALRDVD